MVLSGRQHPNIRSTGVSYASSLFQKDIGTEFRATQNENKSNDTIRC